MLKVSIIPFEEQHTQHFYDLNVEWLQNYFYVEPYDEKVLSQPKKYILDKGGFIFFAIYNDEIVGTAALINEKECYELSKMAVALEYRGLKIGQQLIDHCIRFSRDKGWKKIMLYSNRKLHPAISLYTKIEIGRASCRERV